MGLVGVVDAALDFCVSPLQKRVAEFDCVIEDLLRGKFDDEIDDQIRRPLIVQVVLDLGERERGGGGRKNRHVNDFDDEINVQIRRPLIV